MDALFADPRSFVSLLGLLVSIATSLYSWSAQRNKAKAAEIERVETYAQTLERRVATLEESMKHLPDKDSLHRLEMTVEGVKGQLGVVAKSLESVDRIAQRIDTFLLENGNRTAA